MQVATGLRVSKVGITQEGLARMPRKTEICGPRISAAKTHDILKYPKTSVVS